MIDISAIFFCVKLSNTIQEYTGLIETVGIKLDKLIGSEFEAGIRALQQAKKSENEKNYLLREARNRFNKAISIESDIRLALSCIGLSVCHQLLGDNDNHKDALLLLLDIEKSGYKVSDISLSDTEGLTRSSRLMILGAFFPWGLLIEAGSATKKENVRRNNFLIDLQTSAEQYLKELG